MQLTQEQFTINFIQLMRAKFQSSEERKGLLSLMIGEVQLQMMKETLQPVDIETAWSMVLDELMTLDLSKVDLSKAKSGIKK